MKIKIFLASSITEFETDRMSFAVYLNELNAIFAKRYGVTIIPFICEAADHTVSKNERKQDDYNEEIADSDIVIFLVGDHLGTYTKEEFDFSCRKLKENGQLRVYVYFCDKGKDSDDVIVFKKTLENEYRHYYDSFEYIDTVKLTTLFNLRRLILPTMKIEVKDNYFVIDGKKIDADVLSPLKIKAFSNNEDIKKLTQRYADAELQDRESILKEINDIQNKILSIYLNASDYSYKGICNIRITEAIRSLENGDLIGVRQALDTKHLIERRKARKKVEKRRIQEGTRSDITELKMDIDILKIGNHYDEIDAKYKQAVNYAINDKICLNILYDYSAWLSSIHRVDDAISVVEQLNAILATSTQDELNDNNITKIDLANLKNLLGVLYRRVSKFKDAYFAYRKAFTCWGECIDSLKVAQLWTLAEYIEDVACFIQNIPDSVSDIVNPFNYSKGVCIGQLATDIMRFKKLLQNEKQIDFSTLESNSIYKSGNQSVTTFFDGLSDDEKQGVISDSVTFVFDNPIFESYILMLFALCIKQSVLDKTKDYSGCAKGLAMTILNIAAIHNMMHDYDAAEDGANLAIKFLTAVIKMDSKADINKDMVHAYGVLYTSYICRHNEISAKENRDKMLEYGEKAFNRHPREFALAYTDMLFHLGMDYLHSSTYFSSFEIFDKIISVFENIEDNQLTDQTQYLIPFFLSNLRWIEAYSQYYRSLEDFQPDFNSIYNRFKNAMRLFDEINKCDKFDDQNKKNCLLELSWCNLLYLPPIGNQDECISLMEQAFETCMDLSLESGFGNYRQWQRTLEVVQLSHRFILFFCESGQEKVEWLNNFSSLLNGPLEFIINYVTLEPMLLIPFHFRRISDYLFYSSPNTNFIKNYNSILIQLYNLIKDELSSNVDLMKGFLKRITDCYQDILEKANELENNGYLLAIIKKEKNKIQENQYQ